MILNNILDKIKQYKTYIIIISLVGISIFSIIQDNIKDKEKVIVNDKKMEINKNDNKIAVYIAGEVKEPGVYYIDEDLRLNDLIEKCGGFTQYADLSDINLAEKLNDADKIEIPRLSDSSDNIDINDYTNEKSDLININIASKEELKSLNGIGDTLADNIINYRNKFKFESVEDLLNVNGIGESKYNTIKEYICVN